MAPLGLYIHVPFCASICHYCNFNRGLFDAGLKTRYVRAVAREIQVLGDGTAADTIFFGGGTPSLLDPAELGAVIQACRDAFDVSPGAEITIEANPDTVTRASLEACRAAGVTRLSFGVQSYRDDELIRLGRRHDSRRARDAVADARGAGFDNVSVDLMMWLPEQHLSQWLDSVDALVHVGPDHASLYMLELYPNAPLRDTMARANWSLAPDDDAAAMYEEAMNRLETAGLQQYEISNVARPGFECRHNLKYWTDGEWIGFGPGAHSTRAGRRWANVSATVEYVDMVEAGRRPALEPRVLAADDRWREALMTGLRLTGGVSLEAFRLDFGVDLLAQYGDHLRRCFDAGVAEASRGRLRLTRRGMLLANEVLAVFF